MFEEHANADILPSSSHHIGHLQQMPTSIDASDPDAPHAVAALTQPGTSQAQSHKRKADSMLHSGWVRKIRTCQKCAQPNCPGAGSRAHCKNACQDCGKTDCRGRNSHHPQKDCQTGWIGYHQRLKGVT